MKSFGGSRITQSVGVLVLSAAGVVNTAGSATQQGAGEPASDRCRSIPSDVQRLECYDAVFGSPEKEVIERSDVERGAAGVADMGGERTSLLDERWELASSSKRGPFRLTPFKPVYILAAFHTTDINEAPSSPNEQNNVTVPFSYSATEAKYQISFKSKLWEDVIGNSSDLWFAYTQSSRWQLFNAADSRPFRETDYEPELMFTLRTNYSVLDWTGRIAGVGVNHQSNGRPIPLSRSWNRAMAMVGLENDRWALMLRAWKRLDESARDDDNPDIEDFMGRADLLLTRTWDSGEISLVLRHSLRDGARSHGAVGLDWAFPIYGNLRGYLQLFDGYGESLIDYNHDATYIGAGISLVNWYAIPRR